MSDSKLTKQQHPASLDPEDQIEGPVEDAFKILYNKPSDDKEEKPEQEPTIEVPKTEKPKTEPTILDDILNIT